MFRSTARLIILFSVLFVMAVPALAWDETGHKITAYIAWQQMTPDVRERVLKTLTSAPEDSQISAFYLLYGSRSAEARKREYFMLMATWADIIRDKNVDTRYKKYHNGNWHYADTFWQLKSGKVEFVENNDESGLALQKLADFDQVIRGNASDADKAVAIAWLEHLVGDIHQPLHASAKVSDSNKKGDQGGNLFFLTPKGTPRDKQENLHWYWDSIIGREMPNAKDQCDANYLDPIAENIIKLYPYDKMKDKLEAGNFAAWAKESLDIATTDVYKDLKWFEAPSDKYRKKAFDIGEKRMALAGYRMGELFNRAFGKP